MKIAFITNDISYYGASRSLKTLLNALNEKYEEIDVHLIVPKRLKSANDFDYLSRWFGIERSKIYEYSLPFYNNYKGNNVSIFHRIFNLKWRLNKNPLYNFLEQNNFDVIHLNSLTLLPLANENLNMVLHVREVLNNINDASFIQRQLNGIKKVLFIDQATFGAFKTFSMNKSMILNNPFSMTYLADKEKPTKPIIPEEIISEKIVFALIGKIHEEKGTEFIINTFNQIDNKQFLLLIKGGGTTSYVNHIKNIAGDTVFFLEEGPDVEDIYRFSDYILRGEPYPCIGRTTFEALFSGLGVVLPGTLEYYADNLNGFIDFKGDILTYEPRNSQKLLDIVTGLKKRPVHGRKFLSNTENYAVSFVNFIKE